MDKMSTRHSLLHPGLPGVDVEDLLKVEGDDVAEWGPPCLGSPDDGRARTVVTYTAEPTRAASKGVAAIDASLVREIAKAGYAELMPPLGWRVRAREIACLLQERLACPTARSFRVSRDDLVCLLAALADLAAREHRRSRTG